MLPAILAAAGLVKGLTVDKWKEDRQRELAANTQRYSPWTGLRAGPIEEADPLGSTMQGGVQGLLWAKNMDNAAAQDKLIGAQTDYYNRLNQPEANIAVGEQVSPLTLNTMQRRKKLYA